MNTTQKAILFDLFQNYAKAKATGKYKEAEEIEKDFLEVLRGLSFRAKVERLEENIKDLEKRLKEDKAGFASTMLYYDKRRLEELGNEKRLLFSLGEITVEEETLFNESLNDIRKEIFKRLQERLFWIAERLDDVLDLKRGEDNRNETAIILANSFNDVFRNDWNGTFTGDQKKYEEGKDN